MGHNLTIENGKASMMYVGEAPWHGLGTKLEKLATSAEAIQAAGLDWHVVKRPLYVVGDGHLYTVQNKAAVMREDLIGQPDCPVFGVVSENYSPLQNRDAFAFFDTIVGKEAAIYHTAGSLGRGERVWMLAKLPGHIRVVGDDITEKFLLLSNSHDGSSAVQIKFTPIRVVCQNTLTMALQNSQGVRIQHTRDMATRMQQATKLLNIVDTRYAEIEKAFKRMVQVQITESRLTEYINGVFPDPPRPARSEDKSSLGSDDAQAKRLATAIKRVNTNRLWTRHFFEAGRGNTLNGVKGTLWAAYNAVTELCDHRQGLNQERHLASIWFGEGYQTKVRAYDLAVAKAAAWPN